MKEWGILVPIVTPCLPGGEVDLDGLRQVSADMVAAGCHSLFVGGSTGRGPWWSREVNTRICSTVAGQVGSQVKVVAGAMSLGQKDMLDNAFAMADAGAQAAVITAPGYFKYSLVEVERILLNFADACPIPVMVYDIPDFTGLKLSKDLLLRLARHERVIGIKDSTDDFERFQLLLSQLQTRPEFYLLQGKERWLAESLRLGASGFVVSMVHVEPVLFAALYQAVRSGNLKLAGQFQAGVNQLMDLVRVCFQRRPETSTLFHFLNQVLILRGVCGNILLDHDGDCPDWLADLAHQAYSVCYTARLSLLAGEAAQGMRD